MQRADAVAAGRADLSRFELAEALAAAYDKYQAYRRDWLQRWEAGADAQDWQAMLWRNLRKHEPTPHRAALIGAWLARFDRRAPEFAGAPPPGLPPRLSAFGTIHVSPDVLHLLAMAGQWCALDFYLPAPSAEYWGDVESLRARLRHDGVERLPEALAEAQRDNPLLQAWGAAGREIVAQLYAYDIVQPDRETELFDSPGRGTLLRCLQQDVLERRAPEAWGDIAATAEASGPHEVSLQIHACHSKLREVEVLHDQLRSLLDDTAFDPPLQPREIAVLAPDIAEYLPLARAVFGGFDAEDPRYIPFSLADRPQLQTHPLVGLFLGLFDLAEAAFTVSAFRDRLAVPAVMRAMGLDAAQLAKIDAWLAAAGIRWGEDAAARERAGVGRWPEYSFAFGLERMLGGYAAGAGELRDAQGRLIAPYGELEGGDAELLDRLLAMYARLRDLAAWMRRPHEPADWQKRMAEAFLALTGPPGDEGEAQARRRILEALDLIAVEAADAGPLPAALLRRALHDVLAQPSPHQPWLSGGVVFAGMVPLRTVPFRVICLLGLDADAYPRRDAGNGVNRLLDAIQGRPQRRLGDRSVRDDDRFLFLQLLCAAGDVFYLSYGGRDARDGSLREPSPLIGELLDVVERMRGARYRERMIVEHPLQPFSPRAFGAEGADRAEHAQSLEPRRFSYRHEWRLPPSHATGEPVFATTLKDDPAQEPPDREALQRFFANPARAWLRERLDLRLVAGEIVHADREPMGGGDLERYHSIEALLGREGDLIADAEQAQAWLQAQALLPPGRDGTLLAADAQAVSTRLLAARERLREGQAHLVVESAVAAPVAYRFDDVYASTRVILSAGRLDGKRRLRAGIDHLLLATALGAAAQTRLLAYDRDRDDIIERAYPALDADTAREALQRLLALWREGRRTPLPFAPKAAWAYAEALRAGDDARQAWQKACAAFSPFQGRRESDDPWLRLAFRPDGLLDDFDSARGARFRDIAVLVLDAVEPAP
ncbi:MAG: exodeoxyribonuclease V subunit gamma [Lysobacteraceae bacterium]|nr:MAG: exodeoxyribonuclease V subunit gamma [Xanthomonadaceae bacterium]